MGLISPKRESEGGGVTNEELDLLLEDEPRVDKPPRRPSRLKCRDKKTSSKKS
jgi:hypothetical protein